jgi:SAM-dependent methyltransferase
MPSDELRRIERVYEQYNRPEYWKWQNNRGQFLMIQERNESLERLLATRVARPLSDCRVLEVGCGNGNVLRCFNRCGVRPENIVGIDLLGREIEEARRRYPSFVFRETHDELLDFPDRSFDVVVAFLLFSTVLDPKVRKIIASEMCRVLKDDGLIAWYDLRYSNPWNSNVRAMTLSRIRTLFPGFRLALDTITLMPPLAYRFRGAADFLYPKLAGIPFLRSHRIGLLSRER